MESSLRPGGTFRQVFAACEALSPRARLDLASRLPAVAGRPPALLAGELAVAPLPHDAGRRAVLRAIVEADLDASNLAQLAGMRLRVLVPAISGRSEAFDPGPNQARLRALVERQGAPTWAKLAELTIGEIMAWAGMGPRLLATLIGVAVEAGMRSLDDGDDGTAPAARVVDGPDAGGDDVRLLLEHGERAGDGALLLALERLTEPGAPEPVRAAAGRLLTLPTPVPSSVAWLDRVLAAAGDHRDRAVFVHGVLGLDDRPARPAIAEALGVGVERVRQLMARAHERVVAASASPPDEVARTRDDLARRLGSAAPVRVADDLLVAAGLPPLPDTRSLLLLWLGGPYAGVAGKPGWLATDAAGLLADTRRALSEDGGVRPTEQVHKELDVAGVPEEHIGPWLAQQPVVTSDGLLVLTTGSLADVAERGLFAAGRALTARQLAAIIWPDAADAADHDGLERALHRDARFVRVSADEFELTEWGNVPYRDVPAGVAPTGDEADRCWLEVGVDEAVLAGAAGCVPAPLATALGLREGDRRTFTTRFGPVALAYDGGRAVRGTLRPVVLAAGAGMGDVVALGFHPRDGSAMVTLVPSRPLDQTA